jgi:dissimilatory sulfite reductase (desulfoviridin) alpha/beta subunit
MQKAINEFRNLPNIDPKALQYVADTVGIAPDVLAGTQRADQINALRQMQDIASKGGMDDAAIAANQQASMQAARANQADNLAISGSLARRGLQAGSGAELAMRQGAAQQAYNTRAMEGAQNAASAQMRALQAIQSSGRLAGDIASDE